MKKIILMLALIAPMTVFAQKFGHLNQQEILTAMPELQKKSEEYDKSKSTMNATKQQETEANLQQLYQKIQQAYQDNQQALQKLQQEKMQPLVNKIQTAINNVGKAGNYVYIMDASLGIPYISTTLSTDVTAAVKAEMNKLK